MSESNDDTEYETAEEEEDTDPQESSKDKCTCNNCPEGSEEPKGNCCMTYLRATKECQAKGYIQYTYLKVSFNNYLDVECVTQIPRLVKMMDKVLI